MPGVFIYTWTLVIVLPTLAQAAQKFRDCTNDLNSPLPQGSCDVDEICAQIDNFDTDDGCDYSEFVNKCFHCGCENGKCIVELPKGRRRMACRAPTYRCECDSGYNGHDCDVQVSEGIPGLSCPLTVAEGCTQDGSTTLDVWGNQRSVTQCQCIGNFDLGTGCIVNLLYIPNPPYDISMDFRWYFKAADGHGINIEITNVDIESTSGCSWDSVKVYNGPSIESDELIRLCGTDSNSASTTGSDMVVRFESDDTVTRNGFNGKVCFVLR